jgi:hypothetical protein
VKSDESVARAQSVRAKLCSVFQNSNGKSGNINVIDAHYATVLCRLSANERGVCATAPFGNGRHNRGDAIWIQFANSDDVKEKEWLGTNAYKVIYQHGNKVMTDTLKSLCDLSDVQLRTYTISAGNQNGVLDSDWTQIEESAEIANRAHDARAMRRCDH